MKRWLVLFATVANIIFNGVYSKIFDLPPINVISDKYFNLFTPAGYAFAIWGLIYLSFIAYAIFQLLPSQQSKVVYNQLAIPFVIINLLGSLWIIAFTAELIFLSILIMIATLITAIYLYEIAAKSVLNKEVNNKWIIIPFSLFLGWISVATIANFSAGFVSMGWNGEGENAIYWTILMICVAGVLGIVFSIRKKNIIYPMVIAWAVFAIYIARKNDQFAISVTALAIVTILLLAVIFILFRRKKVAD